MKKLSQIILYRTSVYSVSRLSKITPQKIAYMNKNKYFCYKKNYMLDIFQKFLSTLGATFTVDNDTISFEYNGLQFLFTFDISDPYYFRLILPNIGEINEVNENFMKQHVNQMNLNIKVAKATIINDRIWVSIEQFVYSKDNLPDLFKRSISVLEAFMTIFRQSINE